MVKTRKRMSEAEKARRRHERSAARKNAKRREEIPLFAALEADLTGKDEFWHWRRNKALAAERCGFIEGSRILRHLQITQAVLPFARRTVGEDAFRRLDAYCRRTFKSVSYWYDFWAKALSGDEVTLSLEVVKDRKPGESAFRVTDRYQGCHHMDKQDFYARFPYRADSNGESPDLSAPEDLIHSPMPG